MVLAAAIVTKSSHPVFWSSGYQHNGVMFPVFNSSLTRADNSGHRFLVSASAS